MAKSPRRSRGTLSVIVLLLLGSAIIRIIAGADAVLAENNQKPPETMEMAEAEPEAPQVAELSGLLEALKKREERITRRERQVEKRMVALNIAEEKIITKLEQLKKAETELRSTIALASTAAEDDLARLTAVYENMKPKTASALFSEMDSDFAAGFLARMRPDSAAAVLAGMTPDKAYEISAILAGRNANVPKN